MRRRPMSKSSSRKTFRKATGVHTVNRMNPRKFRGGIRL
nr:MAG: hypothetical protein [Microvirus sp.]